MAPIIAPFLIENVKMYRNGTVNIQFDLALSGHVTSLMSLGTLKIRIHQLFPRLATHMSKTGRI